uniref:Uncharacterized protein n=1 Tax=Micrurus lemniscatus lemniscatus TaxID=129467 RepID=A0A2D4HIK1_MICLE
MFKIVLWTGGKTPTFYTIRSMRKILSLTSTSQNWKTKVYSPIRLWDREKTTTQLFSVCLCFPFQKDMKMPSYTHENNTTLGFSCLLNYIPSSYFEYYFDKAYKFARIL